MKTFEQVHISTIKHGDTILHDGKEMTVNREHIKSGFIGIMIFGDSYRGGSKLVTKILFN